MEPRPEAISPASHYLQPNRFNKAFTLIEISIVLVIIGLIAGGILVGRDLIAAAAIRAQISQIEKYNTAVNSFLMKYDCLAGDCGRATRFFGSSYAGTPLVDGNEDRQLIDTGATGPNYNPVRFSGEPTQVFLHLFAAGLSDCCKSSNVIYNGWYNAGMLLTGTAYPSSVVGSGGFVPMTLNGVNGWWLGVAAGIQTTGPCGGGNYGDYLNLQAGGPCSGRGLMTSSQARAIDQKIDDGQPTTGRVFSAGIYGGDNKVHPHYPGFLPYCIASNLTYDLSQTGSICSLFMSM